jgi:adenylyl-sulfate kinase
LKHNLFIGRWAPFHAGHKYIIDSFVNNGKAVCIAVRNTPISEKDPFDAFIRKSRIDEIYKDNPNVKVMIIPDIETVCVGREVGYSIMEVPQNIKTISGTKERKKENYTSTKGFCIWLTGLPCSGKTTIAEHLKHIMSWNEKECQVLDGDVLRKAATKHLGFSPEERKKNIIIAANIAKTLINHGVNVVCAFVSPDEEARQEVRSVIGADSFLEVYVKASKEECEKRDVKGMWKQAREGKIKNFTGLDGKYDIPVKPDLIIDTEQMRSLDSALAIYRYLYKTEGNDET